MKAKINLKLNKYLNGYFHHQEDALGSKLKNKEKERSRSKKTSLSETSENVNKKDIYSISINKFIPFNFEINTRIDTSGDNRFIRIPNIPVRNFYQFSVRSNDFKKEIFLMPLYSYKIGFVTNMYFHVWKTDKYNLFETIYYSFKCYYKKIIFKRKDIASIRKNKNLIIDYSVVLSLIYFDKPEIIKGITNSLKFSKSFNYIYSLMRPLSRIQRFLFEIMVNFDHFAVTKRPFSNNCDKTVANRGRPVLKQSRHARVISVIFRLRRNSILLNKLGNILSSSWKDKEFNPSESKSFKSSIMENLLLQSVDLISDFLINKSPINVSNNNGGLFYEYCERELTL